MPTSGPNYPSSCTDGGGGSAWTAAGNAKADDGSDATFDFTTPATTDNLVASGFGFSIPSTAEVTQIAVEIKCSGSYQDSGLNTFNLTGTCTVSGVAGAPGASTQTIPFSPDSYITFDFNFSAGNSSGGDVNATLQVNFNATGPAGLVSGHAQVDAIRVSVSYNIVTPNGWLPGAYVQVFHGAQRLPPEIAADQSRQTDPALMLAAEAPHAETFAKMFVPRGPDRWRMYWLPMMGYPDPTSFTLPNAPEPIHSENYPCAVYLPNPRPKPQAWQFPIMQPTDYEGLLTTESAHPEITRQLACEVPPRHRMRQFQPRMSVEDPGALAAGNEPTGVGYKPPELPHRARRRIQTPPIDQSFYQVATPGDPSTYPTGFAMASPLPVARTMKPMGGESLMADSWSGQQFVQPSMVVPLRGPHMPRQMPIQAGDTAPQYFEDQQVIGWQVPLSVPVRSRQAAKNVQLSGEVSGETFDLALVEPSSWGPNAPVLTLPSRRGKTPHLETIVEDVRSIADVDGWQSAQFMPTAGQRARPPRNESLLPFTDITTANTTFLASMTAPALPRPKQVRGQTMESELIPPTGTGTYPIADYVLPMSVPLFKAKPANQQPQGAFFYQDDTLQTLPDLAAMSVIPQPVPKRLQAAGFDTPRDEFTVLLVSHWQEPLSLPIRVHPQPVRLPGESAVYDTSAQAPPVTAIGPMPALPQRKLPTNAVMAAPFVPLPLDPLNVASDFLAMPVEQRHLQPAQPNVIQLVIQPDAAPTPAIIAPMPTSRPGERLKAAQPTPLRFQTDQQYFGEVVMPASYESRPAMPLARAKPLPQAIADPLTEAPTSFQVLAGLDGMITLPLRSQPRQQPKEQATQTPPLANIPGGFDSMDASAALRRRHRAPQIHSPLPTDQQYFAEAIKPASYEASWFLPHPTQRPLVQPMETASTTMYLAGGNPATFAGSGAFVVVAGAIYSLSPVAGKVTGSNRGI